VLTFTPLATGARSATLARRGVERQRPGRRAVGHGHRAGDAAAARRVRRDRSASRSQQVGTQSASQTSS
jgi:hypothetical protein